MNRLRFFETMTLGLTMTFIMFFMFDLMFGLSLFFFNLVLLGGVVVSAWLYCHSLPKKKEVENYGRN